MCPRFNSCQTKQRRCISQGKETDVIHQLRGEHGGSQGSHAISSTDKIDGAWGFISGCRRLPRECCGKNNQLQTVITYTKMNH